MSPAHFFEGVGTDTDATGPSAGRRMRRDEFEALTEAFAAITDPHTRASVLALVRSLTAESRRRRIAR